MIVIVGGTGKLGGHIVRQLLPRGERVRIMTRDPARARELCALGAVAVRGDLRDVRSIEAAVSGARVVISASHAIVGGRANSSELVDDAGQRALIDASQRAAVSHFVFTSVLGAAPYHAVDFWRTKWRMEQHLIASNVPFTIVRPSAFIEMHAFELIGKAVLAGKRVMMLGPGTNERNFVAAADVARIVARAIGDGVARNQAIDIGGPQNLSNLQVVKIFEQFAKKPARVTHMPLSVVNALSRGMQFVHPGVSRILKTAAISETTDQTFDATALAARYAMSFTSVEQWAREYCSTPTGRGDRRPQQELGAQS